MNPHRVAAVAALLMLAASGCESGGGGGGLQLGGSPRTDDVWCVRALAVRGANHAGTASGYADVLKSVRGLKPDRVRLESRGDSSDVLYGRYAREYDVRTGRVTFKPDPAADLALIRGVTIGSNKPFYRAALVAAPVAAGGHPERRGWDLANLRDGYWSLHVAVFYNTEGMTQRRQAAEEYCKLLRDQGVEAYFHHGDVNSSVCVGVFPYSAVVTEQVTDPGTQRVRVESVIKDPRLIDLQRRFPDSLENGHRMLRLKRDASGAVVGREANPSFIVKLPNAVEPGRPGGRA